MLVAGATGFAGALAAHLLWRHPGFRLVSVTGRSELGRTLEELYPRYRVPMPIEELDAGQLAGVDAAVVAYPHAAAAPTVGTLRELGARVVDLSADFRLASLATYERWYGDHPRPELMSEAVYGLTELHREEIAGANIVANPGCYPTASLLALGPLAREGLIADVVIDAKQGISGAGRAFDESTHLSIAGENIVPYKVAEHRHTPEIEEQLDLLDARPPALAVQFQASLVPLDQGEMASCYVTTSGRVGQEELDELFSRAYASEPFVEVVSAPPGVREVRETNFCRLFAAADAHTGKVLVFSAIDNLWKGTSSQAVQNLNLMFGLPERRASRERGGTPARARVGGRRGRRRRPSSARAGCRARRTSPSSAATPACPAASARRAWPPASSRAATPTSACSSATPRARSAPRASPTAARAAAPVLLSRERCRLHALRVVLANSGCANAATGRQGLDDAAKTQGAAAMATGVDPSEVALASTGGISHRLPVEAVLKGVLAASEQLSGEGDASFQRAIQTTDAFEKRANLRVELPSGTVHLSAQCKGAGMISPRFATMLCFVETDAALTPDTADLLLGVCVQRSFDRISVDGQLSTNDTAILMCSGTSGVRRRARDRGRAALRRGARRAAAPARADDRRRRRGRRARCARVVVHGGHPARRGRRPRGRELAAGEGRAARRRPELGADRAGRRRGAHGDGAAAGGRGDRGHPGVRGRRRDPLRPGRARQRRAAATRSSTRSACRARAPTPRCSSPTSRKEYVTVNAEYTT